MASDLQLKLIEAATRDAQEAMKVALAINGGGATAVLVFMGALASKTTGSIANSLPLPFALIPFAIGVLCASITAACAYVSNTFYAAAHTESIDPTNLFTRGNRYRNAAAAFVIASIVAFIAGLVVAGFGIARLATTSDRTANLPKITGGLIPGGVLKKN